MKTSTYFILVAEFGTAEIPLQAVCEKYFGMKFDEARRRAAAQRLPVPVHRVGSQKAPWLVNAADLAERIDAERASGNELWQKMKAA